MKYCQNCQRIASDDEMFCTVCGKKIQDDVFPEVEPIETEPAETEPEYVQTKLVEAEPVQAVRQPERTNIQVVNDEEGYSLLKKIALISLAVFLPPIGLIVGLIVMSDKERYKKEIGQIALIVSVVVFVAVTLCCCVLGTYGIFSYS